MIRPKPRSDERRVRWGAFGVTLLLLLGAHAGLKAIPVPVFGSGREVIRELDALILERFARTNPPETTDVPAVADVVEEAADEPVAAVTFEQEVGLAMEELGRRFALDDGVAPSAGQRAAEPDEIVTPGIAEAAAEDRFQSLFGADEGVVVGRAGRGRGAQGRGGQGGGTSLGLAIDERTVEPDSAPAGEPTGPVVAVETAAERTDAEGSEAVILEYDAESFDGSEADQLAVWLRGNPSELPVGVRVHVNFEPSFLTAAVPFASEGRRWELYLMYNQSLRELHIVLVEGDRSVYLIDRGFQEQSRSLREGTVRRVGGAIVAVDSRTAAPSSEQAREFYNVFLSWWERAKADVGSN